MPSQYRKRYTGTSIGNPQANSLGAFLVRYRAYISRISLFKDLQLSFVTFFREYEVTQNLTEIKPHGSSVSMIVKIQSIKWVKLSPMKQRRKQIIMGERREI